ncbi:MAG: prepilin-type N-terminal cleavage/methylation domain-containing protein [Planctomycetes bacterium]|nr:prepilin-type N-terminal cleavage/methylation domain-containing protein [Planctomycetota bacterium]
MAARRTEPVAAAGFTLLELMIVVSILAILAGIGVPQYVSALRTARIGKARHELVTMSHAIDAYAASNAGRWPLTLHQVGFGGRRDPWGVPYCYLNYADGTGDGLHWAIEVGLVDPSAIVGGGGGGSGTVSGGAAGGLGGETGGASGSLGPRRAGFVPWPRPRRPRAIVQDEVQLLSGRVGAARDTAATVLGKLDREVLSTEADSLVTSIAASTGFSMFTDVPTEATRRRDRYMFPLNTDYDLFSLGPNGRTSVSLGEIMGQDDVIRANNGGFFGLASDY